MNSLINRFTLPKEERDNFDGYNEMVTISAPYGEGNFNDVKNAIQTVMDTLIFEVKIPYQYGPYDCTGQHYTSSIDLLKRFVSGGHVHYVYSHWIGVDC